MESSCEAHSSMGNGGGDQTTINDSLAYNHVLMPELHNIKRRSEFSDANVQGVLSV
jgi:hypothetical protein